MSITSCISKFDIEQIIFSVIWLLKQASLLSYIKYSTNLYFTSPLTNRSKFETPNHNPGFGTISPKSIVEPTISKKYYSILTILRCLWSPLLFWPMINLMIYLSCIICIVSSFCLTILISLMPMNCSTKLTLVHLLISSVQPRNLPRVSSRRMSNMWYSIKNSRNDPLKFLIIIWRVYIISTKQPFSELHNIFSLQKDIPMPIYPVPLADIYAQNMQQEWLKRG